MQDVHFINVEDFLGYLAEHERKIVDYLRDLILECMPDCVEKLAYNVPYYYLNSRVCFIWPASVPWGNAVLSGVQLGFCQGYLLRDDSHFLERGNRKQVYVKTFRDLAEIDTDIVRSFVFEAIEVDRNQSGKR